MGSSLVLSRLVLSELAQDAEPVCGAVAIGPRVAVTAAHCVLPPALEHEPRPDLGSGAPGDRMAVINALDWTRHSAAVSSYATATWVDHAADVALLALERDVALWALPARPSDGPATLVRRFRVSHARLEDGTLTGADVQRGDSGSGVWRDGRLVGVVSTVGGRVAGLP